MNSLRFKVFKHLVNIGSHYYPVICGNAEQCDETYPYRYAQVYFMHLEHVTKVQSCN